MSCEPIMLRCNGKLGFVVKFRQYSKSIAHSNVNISIIKILCIWFQHRHLGWPVWQLGGGNGNTNILTYVFPTYLCTDVTSSTQPPWPLLKTAVPTTLCPFLTSDRMSNLTPTVRGVKKTKKCQLEARPGTYSWFVLIYKYLKSAFFSLYISELYYINMSLINLKWNVTTYVYVYSI